MAPRRTLPSLVAKILSTEGGSQAEVDLAHAKPLERVEIARGHLQALGQPAACLVGEVLATSRNPSRGRGAMHPVRLADRVDGQVVDEAHFENRAIALR